MAAVANVLIRAACPSNLVVTWSPLTLQELRSPANASHYVVTYAPTSSSETAETAQISYLEGAMVSVLP